MVRPYRLSLKWRGSHRWMLGRVRGACRFSSSVADVSSSVGWSSVDPAQFVSLVAAAASDGESSALASALEDDLSFRPVAFCVFTRSWTTSIAPSFVLNPRTDTSSQPSPRDFGRQGANDLISVWEVRSLSHRTACTDILCGSRWHPRRLFVFWPYWNPCCET